MSFILLFLFLNSNFLLHTFAASAQTPVNPTPVDYQLPFPGILPDHPLYTLKKIRDWLLFTFNSNPVKKIELNLLFADKKIGMAQNLVEKKQFSLGLDIILESQTDLLKSAQELPDLSENNLLPVGLPDKIELSTKKHREIINELKSQIPNEYEKGKIKQALKLNDQAINLISSIK